MAAQISRGDLDKIVIGMAKSGKPAPGFVTKDARLQQVYQNATGKPPAAAPAKPAGEAAGAAPTPAPAATKPAKPSSSRTRRPARSSGRARTSSPRPAGPVPLPRTLTRMAGGSTTGGLFLAIFLYPIALAVFQHGPAGFGMWLKAKFLNITTDPNPPATAAPDAPSPTPGNPISPSAQGLANSLGQYYGANPPAAWQPGFHDYATAGQQVST